MLCTWECETGCEGGGLTRSQFSPLLFPCPTGLPQRGRVETLLPGPRPVVGAALLLCLVSLGRPCQTLASLGERIPLTP